MNSTSGSPGSSGSYKYNDGDTWGMIHIKNGVIFAYGSRGANGGAGIGGGQECGTGRIRIFGGTITANGGKYAAGIGGGNWDQNGNIYIYGGDVTAKGGETLYSEGQSRLHYQHL